ncbi:MAG: VacJ family lipoprotein [Sneathiella sp.]|nr:VacJ family lipoprotein [Sneathiella sp.]
MLINRSHTAHLLKRLIVSALLFLALQSNLPAASLPAGYERSLEQAAKTINQDKQNRALQASLNMPVNRNFAWENAVVANVVSQYWEAYPDRRSELITAAKGHFPNFTPSQDPLFLASASPYQSTGLHPSSQYIQPSLQKYRGQQFVNTADLFHPKAATHKAKYPFEGNDPFEGFNRGVFYFNAKFDKYFFIPITDLYQFVTPDFVETGIHNVFNNIGEITSFGNEILQLKLDDALKTFLRFGINTTLGLGGFVDVATEMGLPEDKEDFGQTLGYWGVGEGPYIVIPIFGPSNLRDGTGLIVDTLAFAYVDPLTLDSYRSDHLAIYGIQAVDIRASIDYRYHISGSPFEYEIVRYLISKKRTLDILK